MVCRVQQIVPQKGIQRSWVRSSFTQLCDAAQQATDATHFGALRGGIIDRREYSSLGYSKT